MDKPTKAGNAPKVMQMEPGTYYWCACGKSENQPFCSGAHHGTEFTPVKTVIDSPKQVAWCMCKQSKNKPFCDGSHRNV
jgi:CDGSH-type Zn-finger protein